VIPAEFEYRAPETLDEAAIALAEGGEDAKLLAGGHSLIPLMKLRLAAPTLLVDLRKVGLRDVSRDNGTVRFGAMVRHTDVATGAFGLASAAAATIADQQVRNMGTIGGTLAHGDPASDMPAVVLALGGSFVARGPAGERTIPAAEFFTGFLETALRPDEMLTEIRLPKAPGARWSFQKFNRRALDWAIVGVAAVRNVPNGRQVKPPSVALVNMGSAPLRATAVEEALSGADASPDTILGAAGHAAEATSPPSDTNGSAEYRQELAKILVRRAVEEALAR